MLSEHKSDQSEYELATQRLEILAKIRTYKTYDETEKELKKLQEQLQYFDDSLIEPLLKLPALNGDRSQTAIEALKNELEKFKDVKFFKEIYQLITASDPNAIFAKFKDQCVEFVTEFVKVMMEDVNHQPLVAEVLKQYIAAYDEYFAECLPKILQQMQKETGSKYVDYVDSVDQLRKDPIIQNICDDFESKCNLAKEKVLNSVSKEHREELQKQLDRISVFHYSGAKTLRRLYLRIEGSKENEMSRNEALDHFKEKITQTKQEISSGIEKCHETQRQLQRLQEELKNFDEWYFSHPNIKRVIPRNQLWKLCVDARDHRYGSLVYDEGLHGRGDFLDRREPGYLDGAETALAFVLRSVGVELTPDFIGQVHRIACYFLHLTGLSVHSDSNMQDSPYYPDKHGNLPIRRNFCSKKGIEEVADWRIWKDSLSKFGMTLDSSNVEEFLQFLEGQSFSPLTVGRNGSDKYMPEYIQQYYEWMREAGDNKDGQLLAIIKFGRLIDASHPFTDGNIRTVRLLMFMLMIANDLDPTMMMNPNLFDSYHSSEILVAVKEGQHTYQLEYLLANIDKPEFEKKLKEKIIDSCEECHNLFIYNHEKELCERFPEHTALIKARTNCALEKEEKDGFNLSYTDEKVRSDFEAKTKAIFNKYHHERPFASALPETLFGKSEQHNVEASVNISSKKHDMGH